MKNSNDKSELRIRVKDYKIWIPNHGALIIKKKQNPESESHPDSCDQEITIANHIIRRINFAEEK